MRIKTRNRCGESGEKGTNKREFYSLAKGSAYFIATQSLSCTDVENVTWWFQEFTMLLTTEHKIRYIHNDKDNCGRQPDLFMR